MLGRFKFKVGQRVRPSAEGIEAHIFPKTRHNQSGVVQKVDRFNCPTVLWERRKTASGYHPRFIAPDRRRTHEDGLMTATPQAIEAARKIEAQYGDREHMPELPQSKRDALTVARALLALAALGQSATDAAQSVVAQGGSILLPGDNVDVTFKRGHLRDLIAQAIAAFAAAQVAAAVERCAQAAYQPNVQTAVSDEIANAIRAVSL